MKKTIISGFIILITMNVDAQSCQEALKFDGIVALFERKIESIFDSTQEKFINGKKSLKRTFFSVKGKEVQLDDKKYEILETELDSNYSKEYDMTFIQVRYNCIDESGEEYIIEYTKSENVVYNVSIFIWETETKVTKTLYQH